ncbi:MAG: hypothetical protein ACLT4A_00155 [Anaerobutyricum soehngenii]
MGAMVSQWFNLRLDSYRYFIKRISIEKIVGFGSVAYLVGIVLTALGGIKTSYRHY